MEIPGYQPFYIHSLAELRAEIARLGVAIPVDDDLSRLAQPLVVAGKTVANRFCAQPIAAGDAASDGAPGELTRRRYRRYAEGRFGLIWMEMTAAVSGKRPGQLCLNEDTLAAFRSMVKETRESSADGPTIVIQLASDHADELIQAAALALEAGFDGVDFQCGRDVLPEALAGAQKFAPELLLSARLCGFDAVRGGFGVSSADFRKHDPAEPIRFVQRLRENGLVLLNVTCASPRLSGPERGVKARLASENPDEPPLMTLARQLELARVLREAAPGLPVVASGFSWVREFVPYVAAGALRDGMIDFAGLGRGALAHPGAPAEVFARGEMDAGSACIVCFACSQLRAEGETVGCVIRDPVVYGPVYQQMRRFDADQLMAGAARCHLCEAAPCIRASPTRTDIAAFIDAFRRGDESRAYEIIRERDPLPEMTARLSPAWIESEGACIETALTGTPVPILDLQYAIAWRARERGETGARVPTDATGKRVAIAGAGPTGIAATIRLIELGHTVDLYEKSERVGGVPERVLSTHRQLSVREEIDAVLQPAIAAGRLRIHVGATIGKDLRLEEMQADHDAILVAAGLWQERSPGNARGVMGALAFLARSDVPMPDRVVVLAGGDAAMDAARAAQRLGANEIFVVFGGPRSELHWHLPESWFASPGVHAMMSWELLGYETDDAGEVRGVRLRHAQLNVESVLHAGLVIEAMGLQADESLCEMDRVYKAGALVNGGASIGQCVADGVAIADRIHLDLFP